MNVRWSHTVLEVRDLDAMVAFYCDALGFTVADRGPLGPGTDIAFLSGSSSDHHQFAMATGRGPDDATSLNHNAFRVDSIDDVKAMFDWVDADERIKGGLPLTHGNAVSVYFDDPEGNGIEVFCDTPWHVRQPQVGTWDPSLSVDEVLAAVEAGFRDEPEFMPMEQYRAERAKFYGEVGGG